jgi:hypothetical protein
MVMSKDDRFRVDVLEDSRGAILSLSVSEDYQDILGENPVAEVLMIDFPHESTKNAVKKCEDNVVEFLDWFDIWDSDGVGVGGEFYGIEAANIDVLGWDKARGSYYYTLRLGPVLQQEGLKNKRKALTGFDLRAAAVFALKMSFVQIGVECASEYSPESAFSIAKEFKKAYRDYKEEVSDTVDLDKPLNIPEVEEEVPEPAPKAPKKGEVARPEVATSDVIMALQKVVSRYCVSEQDIKEIVVEADGKQIFFDVKQENGKSWLRFARIC